MASAAEARLAPVSHSLELPPDHVYFGPSAAMQVVRQRVDRSAGLNVPVLILCESGTGKEILARFIHERSPWRSGPFVKVNCPAIPGTLIESELFGFQKGAFTGAIAAKPGRMEMAQGGSLFLDEIAELDSNLQAKLLHVLQDGHFTRIGDHEERRMDARVICATNRVLRQEIETGGFRADLFYRINVITSPFLSCAIDREIFRTWLTIFAFSSIAGSNTMLLRYREKRCNFYSSATGRAIFANWRIASRGM